MRVLCENSKRLHTALFFVTFQYGIRVHDIVHRCRILGHQENAGFCQVQRKMNLHGRTRVFRHPADPRMLCGP